MAGPKKVEKHAARIETATMIAMVGAPTATAAASTDHQHSAGDIGDQQDHAPIEPIGNDAGRHREEHVRKDPRRTDDPEQHRRVALAVDDHEDGDEVQPVADARDELARQQELARERLRRKSPR